MKVLIYTDNTKKAATVALRKLGKRLAISEHKVGFRSAGGYKSNEYENPDVVLVQAGKELSDQIISDHLAQSTLYARIKNKLTSAEQSELKALLVNSIGTGKIGIRIEVNTEGFKFIRDPVQPLFFTADEVESGLPWQRLVIEYDSLLTPSEPQLEPKRSRRKYTEGEEA